MKPFANLREGLAALDDSITEVYSVAGMDIALHRDDTLMYVITFDHGALQVDIHDHEDEASAIFCMESKRTVLNEGAALTNMITALGGNANFMVM